MKFSNLLMSICITTLILYSCSKDKSKNDTVVTTDSTVLVKVIDLDTTKISGLDTLRVYQYNYDNLKRLTSTEVRLDAMSGGFAIKTFNTMHYYNGTDTLPFKEIENVKQHSSFDINYTKYCSYQNGKLVYDSIVSNFQYTTARKYTHESNRLIVNSTIYTTPTPSTQVRYIYLTRVNGNTIIQLDTTDGVINNFLYSYDNKINPFANKPQSPLIERSAPYYLHNTYSEEMAHERNNITEMSATSGYTLLLKYSYEYNSKGLPIIARVYSQNSNYHFKRLFFYTKL